MHLAEISTSENLHNGRPSTLLRSVPVQNERCGGGRTETFSHLQYKRLPFSIAITSLGEERANLSAFRTFVRFVLV